MSALARAEDDLRSARRNLEAATSEVPAYSVDSLRWLGAEVQALRQRVDSLLRAVEELRDSARPSA